MVLCKIDIHNNRTCHVHVFDCISNTRNQFQILLVLPYLSILVQPSQDLRMEVLNSQDVLKWSISQ